MTEGYVTNTNKRDRPKDSLVCVRMKAYTCKKLPCIRHEVHTKGCTREVKVRRQRELYSRVIQLTQHSGGNKEESSKVGKLWTGARHLELLPDSRKNVVDMHESKVKTITAARFPRRHHHFCRMANRGQER